LGRSPRISIPTKRATGLKGQARVLEKIAEGRSPAGVTDVVRSSFSVSSPEQADHVVAELAKQFPITDEGYKFTDLGYFDRAVNVQFPNGQIGKVLIAPPELIAAKSPDGGGGHTLYAQSRALPAGNPQKQVLEDAQRVLYGRAYDSLSANWKAAVGKAGS
jgi:hypothetical protein